MIDTGNARSGSMEPILQFARFLGSAPGSTAVVDMYDGDGLVVAAGLTLTIGTSALEANDPSNIFGSPWTNEWKGLLVRSTSSTIYTRSSTTAPAVEATSNGRLLVAGMWIGQVPEHVHDAYRTGPLQLAQRSGATTTTTPSITTAASFTLLAANPNRKYLLVQNNSSANIMINTEGGALTDIVPSSTNKGIVLVPGDFYEPQGFIPTGLIKGYQTSGGTINTVVVVEG